MALVTGGQNPDASFTATLTAAQILALAVTPVSLVAAPGANKVAVLTSGWAVGKFGTVSFGKEGSAGPINVGAGAASQPASAWIVDNDVLVATADQFAALEVSGDTGDDLTSVANLPITVAAIEPLNKGSILTKAVGAGGAGYAPGDTGTIANPVGATYTVNTVGGGGAVATFTVNTNPRIYAPGVHATSVDTGGGDGNFTVNILTVSQGDGTLELRGTYRVLSV